MSQLDADSSDDDTLLVSKSHNINSISSSDDEIEVSKKKVNVIISDEESNSCGNTDTLFQDKDYESNTHSNIDSDQEMHTTAVTKSSKIKRIVDSSDEEDRMSGENISKKSNSNNKSFKKKDSFDADSSDEDIEKQVNPVKKYKKKVKQSQLCAESSDDDIEGCDSSDDEMSDTKRRLAADSSDDDRQGASSPSSDNSIVSRGKDTDNQGIEHSESSSHEIGHVKTSKERKSKSSALSEIRSETQRLMRESPFELPYHKPKQRTLEEFLNRKKGTPEVVSSIKGKNFSSVDESRLMEREKRLEDFYKSDEENEQDDTYDNKIEIKDDNIINEKNENGIDLKDSMTNLKEDDHEISNTEVLRQSSNQLIVDCENKNQNEAETHKTVIESLELRLEETPDIENSSCLESSQTKPRSKREMKLEALRKEYGQDFEKTLNTTPTLGSKNDDFFSPQNDISRGAEKLFNTFVTHVQASGHAPNALDVDDAEINVIVKDKDAQGKDILKVETINIDQNNKTKNQKSKKNKMNLQQMKKQLKKEVFAKRLQQMKIKAEISKLNAEEYDELPPDEIEASDVEEEEDDHQYEEDEDEVQSEEDDVYIKEKSVNHNPFLNDEAEDSDDNSDDESESESLNLIEEEDHQNISKKSLEFKKIRRSELLSDDEDTSHQFDTPNLETASVHSLAGSTVSSASSIFNTAPRWTPFKDRINPDDDSKKNMMGLVVDENKSPTASQMAKKRLGFEDLCDENDPEVGDIDDILALCSGKFATQATANAETLQSHLQVGNESQNLSNFDSTTTADKCDHSTETQDTLILTGNSERARSVSPDKLSDIDSLLDDCTAEQSKTVCPPLFEDLPEEPQGVGMRIVDSDDDEEQSEKKNKKRKRVLISDDEDEISDGDNVDQDDRDQKHESSDSDDNLEERPASHLGDQQHENVEKGMFDKNGRLKKNFFDAEAELSGSEDEFSEDEDEKGLDRLELEEGDYDEIDETEERDKIGRVYQKNQLDEDQAELRLFQERFLEDGDLHSENKRQRQFKWKGLDDSLELDRRDSDQEEEGDEVSEQIEQSTLQRLQREKWLKENSENLTDDAKESQFFKISAKVTSNSVGSVPSLSKQPSMQHSAGSGPLQPLNMTKTEQRSSFLSRGQASLDTLSLFAKKVDDRSGTGAKKGRNFVFTAISPEKTVPEDSDNKSENQNEPPAPKLKQNPAKKQKLDRSLGSDNRSTIFNLL